MNSNTNDNGDINDKEKSELDISVENFEGNPDKISTTEELPPNTVRIVFNVNADPMTIARLNEQLTAAAEKLSNVQGYNVTANQLEDILTQLDPKDFEMIVKPRKQNCLERIVSWVLEFIELLTP